MRFFLYALLALLVIAIVDRILWPGFAPQVMQATGQIIRLVTLEITTLLGYLLSSLRSLMGNVGDILVLIFLFWLVWRVTKKK